MQISINPKCKTQTDEYREFPLKSRIDIKTYKKVVKAFYDLAFHDMIYKATIYVFPFNVGAFGILKSKTKVGAFDFQYYKETGVKARNWNLHTGRYSLGINWIKSAESGERNRMMTMPIVYKADRIRARGFAKIVKEGLNIINFRNKHDIKNHHGRPAAVRLISSRT